MSSEGRIFPFNQQAGLLRRSIPYAGHIVDGGAANPHVAVEDLLNPEPVCMPNQFLEFIADEIEMGNVSSPAELFARIDAMLGGLSDDDIDLDSPLEGVSNED